MKIISITSIANITLRFTLLLIPLTVILYDSGVVFPFITPKLFAFQGILLFDSFILLLIWLSPRGSIDLLKLAQTPLFYCHLLLLATMGVSSLFAYNQFVSLWGTVERGEGFVFYIFITLYLILLHYGLDKKLLNLIMSEFVLIGWILIIVEFFQFANGQYRPGSLLNNPTFLSSFFLFTLSCAWWLFEQGTQKKITREYKIFILISLLVFFTGIVLSGTRTTLGVMILTFILLYFLSDNFKKMINPSLMYVAPSLVLFGIAMYYSSSNNSLVRILNFNMDDITFNSRLINYKIAIDSVSPFEHEFKRLIWGWGLENFSFAWDHAYKSIISKFEPYPFDRAHNKFLDLLVMNGLVGLICFFLFWLEILKALLKKYPLMIRGQNSTLQNKSVGLALWFAFISHFFEYLSSFESYSNYLGFYFLVGILLIKNENCF